jgi:hypothetical protein
MIVVCEGVIQFSGFGRDLEIDTSAFQLHYLSPLPKAPLQTNNDAQNELSETSHKPTTLHGSKLCDETTINITQ